MPDIDVKPIVEPSADYIATPFSQDVRTMAGSGEVIFQEDAELHIALPRFVLPAWARLAGLICIRVSGDSMAPMLDDDLLLPDRSHTALVDGQMFVAHGDDGLLVKRLRCAGGGVCKGNWRKTSYLGSF